MRLSVRLSVKCIQWCCDQYGSVICLLYIMALRDLASLVRTWNVVFMGLIVDCAGCDGMNYEAKRTDSMLVVC